MKITVKDLTFAYPGKTVLNGIDVELGHSEIMCIVGPNGCGKSTLLKCVESILIPQKGSILLNGVDVKTMQRCEIAKLLGYVPQTADQVFSSSVFDTVLLGRTPYSSWKGSDKDIDIVIDILTLMDLDDIALSEFNQLSGGQRQRVMIARALAQQPKALIFDEATSALDIAHQLEVMDILSNLAGGKGISVIMVVHDLNLASRYADQVVMMKAGTIHSKGTAKEVLTRKNIASVYGVNSVVDNHHGKISIVPISRINEKQRRLLMAG